MARKKNIKKREILPDPIYNSDLVSMLINRLLKKGKKTIAQRIFEDAMLQIEICIQNSDSKVKDRNKDPFEILRDAIINITPVVEVKSKRVGGSTFQVPREVSTEKGTTLAIRWLISAANSRSERGMGLKLANEILDAANETGNAIRKKEETHRMAEANKAFAHYRS